MIRKPAMVLALVTGASVSAHSLPVAFEPGRYERVCSASMQSTIASLHDGLQHVMHQQTVQEVTVTRDGDVITTVFRPVSVRLTIDGKEQNDELGAEVTSHSRLATEGDLLVVSGDIQFGGVSHRTRKTYRHLADDSYVQVESNFEDQPSQPAGANFELRGFDGSVIESTVGGPRSLVRSDGKLVTFQPGLDHTVCVNRRKP